MIFIAFFLFIALIALALNMMNSSNLQQIEEHLKSQNCNSIIYSKGSYKALCSDKILEISNSFTVDLEKNSKEYKYSDIKNIDIKKFDIVLNENQKIAFKTQEEIDSFYKELKDKIKK
ncbi:hypothetical protein ACH5BF_11305 [Arcobacter sp. YIC-464]|uniref:hypothetical protein n=1 Tax=Arcobacter sp. YIC-464 TaxID=3376631 RepID=UPI003C291251